MDITTRQAGDGIELTVAGRLDAYWADHLSAALDDAVRGGARQLRLDMAGVTFMSSLGIRVLLKFYKQLQRIDGSLTVTNPSDAVRGVLDLAGLGALLATTAPSGPAAAAASAVRTLTRPTATFLVHDLDPDAAMTCHVVGNATPLEQGAFTDAHCRVVSFPTTRIGVGLGALGSDFADCRGRFGEFLAAAGIAAYLPTDGTNVPDCMLAEGQFVPTLSLLYGLVCDGGFTHLMRFETAAGHRAVTLGDLVDAGFDVAGSDPVVFVMVAESAGLMGAALRRSPAGDGGGTDIFGHPQIREWLSFTPERAFPRGLALVVGVAARIAPPALAALLRPLGPGDAARGHFHAAAFSYRPLQKGRIELQPTVASLFEGQRLQGVLHLVNDDRDIVGAGQSEFVRGACWIGRIRDVTVE